PGDARPDDEHVDVLGRRRSRPVRAGLHTLLGHRGLLTSVTARCPRSHHALRYLSVSGTGHPARGRRWPTVRHRPRGRVPSCRADAIDRAHSGAFMSDTAALVQRLAERVQVLEDRLAILDLMAFYGPAVDA